MRTYLYRNPRSLILLLILICLGGISALFSMPNEEDPRVQNRTITILTPFPGATAIKVEQLLTEKIENALQGLEDVDEIRSVSRNELSSIVVTVKDTTVDVDAAFTQIQTSLNEIRQSFPSRVGRTIYDDSRTGAVSVIAVVKWRSTSEVNLSTLRRSALELQDRLRVLYGTQIVKVEGAPNEEIRVLVNSNRMQSLNLSINEVSNIILNSDTKNTGLKFKSNQFNYGVEFAGEITGLTRLGNIILKIDEEGNSLKVNDIASLERGITTPPERLVLHNGKPAIVVTTRMLPNLRITDWTKEVRSVIVKFNEGVSADVEAEVIFDQGEYTSARFKNLSVNLIFGALFVVIILLITLGWRSALIVTSTIPLTGFTTLIALNLLGESINQISVTGLVVALGLLVDAAIVVTDTIRRCLLEGNTPLMAIKASLNKLFIPLLSSTATTVLAFLPIVLLPGDVGQFIGGIGISVIFALVSSLVISLTIIATLAAFFLPPSLLQKNDDEGSFVWIRKGVIFYPLQAMFEKLLLLSFRLPYISIMFALVLPVLGFIGIRSLSTEFFPAADRNQFHIEIRLSEHLTISETIRHVRDAQNYLSSNPNVKDTTWFIGNSAPNFYYNLVQSQDRAPNYAEAMVTTHSIRNMEQYTNEIQADLRNKLSSAQVIVQQLGQGPAIDGSIEIRVYGENIQELRYIGEKIRVIFSEINAITHTNASYTGGTPVIKLNVDQQVALQAGHSLSTLSKNINGELNGVSAGTLNEGSEVLNIRVSSVKLEQMRLSDLTYLNFRTIERDNHIPLIALADYDIVPVPSFLRRYQGRRVNIVTGYIRSGFLPSTALDEFKVKWNEQNHHLPNGYSLSFGGEDEARTQGVKDLTSKLGILLIALIGVSALTFNSFRLAAIVFLVLILSSGLGMFAISVANLPFGFLPIIGLIGLLGVAINAAIIILTGLQNNPGAVLGADEEISKVVMSSSRHIWSTTITTFCGFLPLIFSSGKFWPPFATVIAGGVVLSTVISFFMVPQMFKILTLKRAFTPTLN